LSALAIKHIFHVHSPLTYYVSELVINELKIRNEDVIFISDGYKLQGPSNRRKISFKNSLIKKFLHPNLPKQFDQFIEQEIGEFNFKAYIDLPHLPQRILITHKNCIGFSFIEEGLASYKYSANWEFMTRISKGITFRTIPLLNLRDLVFFIRGINSKLLSLPFDPSGYSDFKNVNYFCLSDLAFPSITTGKVNLKSSISYSSIFILQELAENLNGSIIWIEESFARNNAYSAKEYELIILITIAKLSILPKDTIYLKLRPKQILEESIAYKTLKSKDINVIIFSHDTILEPYLFFCKNISIIGVVSSLLYYATIVNHKVYSQYELFKNIKKPKRSFDDLTFMWDSIICIKKD
jgi:hypothetical protein